MNNNKKHITMDKHSTTWIYWIIGVLIVLVLLLFLMWLVFKKGYTPGMALVNMLKNLF